MQISSSNNSLQNTLTPKEIVDELNRFIVGQYEAKKAMAIALRNRYRRKALAPQLQEEIMPRNILMVGPTGVGKTEIARRLSKLSGAPFIKVEATKFTEVGYVGRDVESVIRDLLEIAINMVKEKIKKELASKAKIKTEERILEVLVGESASEATKEKFKSLLFEGKINDREIEIKVKDNKPTSLPSMEIPGMPGAQMGVVNIGELLGKALGSNDQKKLKKMTVAEAYEILIAEETDSMIDEEKMIREAITLVENDGIVFIDEIDKIASRGSNNKGGEVSREGVQRDFLPLIEGTTVPTKYGTVKTDYILFIASGAFHIAKPSDLLPELQGRLPIRVELKDLSKEDLIRILQEPEVSLIKQCTALMATEGVELSFTKDGIEHIADIAAHINQEVENIGARRLHTVMEKLLEDVSFNAKDNSGKTIVIDKKYVDKHLNAIVKRSDLSNFIL
jgi:ATP-dependent HslUV protease ATP-binding subunit HslU